MKKLLSISALISLLGTLFFAAAPATYAAPDDAGKLKVYYSESIGAGEKVLHITVCDKKPAYAPLKCSKELQSAGGDNYSKKQCESAGSLKEGETGSLEPKIMEGTLIKGCLAGGNDDKSGYPKVDIKKFDNNDKCAEDASQWGYEYVPEWAVVQIKVRENYVEVNSKDILKDQYIEKGTVAWLQNMPIPKGLVASIIAEDKWVDEGIKTMQKYRTSYCAVWDTPVNKSNGHNKPTELQTVLGDDKESAFAKFISGQNGIVDNITEENCNQDNSSQNVPGYKMATPFDDNKTFSCSIQERITGETGTDIFAKYVGALYKWAAGIVGIVAVFTMVYSGIQISMAGGGTIDEAKNRILMSLAGLALLFLSGLILYTINPGFFTG
ncbi:hypothetical protein HZA42_00070 [Candidatus Peregrinibacteria bacterium]|nr:hypothetical protein [Candidatus Peregrinibacteria bacterium]